jgi:RimJ/RimL family protein N-acetyltransferase
MTGTSFRGQLVRLTAINPESDPETIARWFQDSEFQQLAYDEPAAPVSARWWRERLEKTQGAADLKLAIRTLTDDRLIGYANLFDLMNEHYDCWLGIGIGDRNNWDKGYGTDALRILLRFAFQELNRHRVSLDVVAGNARAQRAYEKVGFVVEGRTRGSDHRNGRRRDLIHMGLLRSEWERDEESGHADKINPN